MSASIYNIRINLILVFTVFLFSAPPIIAQQDQDTTDIIIDYGSKGFEISTADGNYRIKIQSRFQFRYSTPFDTNPITFNDFDDNEKPVFKVNRARLKVGGNAYRPWIKYFWEYELGASNLLDFRFMLEKYKFAKFKFGQWKVHYNRERVISSGKQQTLDRSILTRVYTIDRQQGVSVYGRLKFNDILDFNYWISVLTGTGRGSKSNDDSHLMYMSRIQWNFFGREMKFSGSDLDFSDEPKGLIALAAVTNRSPYTRFSQSGGGQLEGFEEGEPGRYRVNQFVVETAFKYAGFSWQQEFHWKEINDLKKLDLTHLVGNLLQFGYFFNRIVSWMPEDIEFAFRHAVHFPDRSQSDIQLHEFAFNINWYFNGHANKVTAEATYFDYKNYEFQKGKDWRYRLQWDISI